MFNPASVKAISTIAVAICVAAAPSLASTTTQGQTIVGSSANELTEEQLIDLRTAAEELGIPFQEAHERFAGQDSFAAAIDQIRVLAPRSFSAAAIELGPGYTAWASFVGEPPSSVRALLSSLPLQVEIRVDASVSEEALVKAQQDIYFKLAQVVDVEHLSSGITQDGYIEFTHPDADFAKKVADVVSESASSRGLKDRIVTLEGDPTVLLTAVSGGETWAGTCSSAFTVIGLGGTATGVSTAGHCANTTSGYTAPGGGVTGNTTAYNYNANGDTMWFRLFWMGETPSITNKFKYTSSGAQRQVLGTANPVVGQSICRYGMSTGNHCTTIAAINECRSGVCLLFRANGNTLAGGDSGGPWYSGNNAQGISHGILTDTWGGKWDLGTRVGALNLLNVTVNTAPVWFP